MRIYFLIPVYNESLNLETLAYNLQAVLPNEDKFYVFVDDCSSDNSVALIHELLPNNCHVITKEKNGGPGDSFNLGFNWILSQSTAIEQDIVVTLEADNTSDLAILPTMTTISTMGYSLVLASVYAQGGGFDKTGFFRKTISLFANMIFRAMFNVKVLTLSSFYRVYHLSLLQTLQQNYPNIIEENGFICKIELLFKAIKYNASIIEVPMVLKSDNRKGKSKMKVFKNMIRYINFLLFNKI